MIYNFTPRELDVLRLVAKAYQRKAIVDELKIGLSTVDDHLQSLHKKTDTHTMAELVKFAISYKFEKKKKVPKALLRLVKRKGT